MKRIFTFCLIFVLWPALAFSFQVYNKDEVSMSIGIWGQAWSQYATDMDTDGDDTYDDDLNDFMMRRIYFSMKGQVTEYMDFFVHYAADRLGQKNLDVAGKGLGSGLAMRGGWANIKLLENDLMFQMGRMYVPFTRDYGTTSTKSLMTTDLNWGQGGYRSGIFYPQNVGRDDSVTLWGNILQDRLQYRFMVGEGVEASGRNPDENPRFAGRLSYNFFDKETSWFNAGTYMGKKRILALGAGMDYQQDLVLDGSEEDYSAWTVDVHFDQPLQNGAVTWQASYIDIKNTVNRIAWTQLNSGSDGKIYNGKAGYLFNQKVGPGRFQPFLHYSYFDVDEDGKDNSQFYGAGMNYYLKGVANKITLEYSYMDQEEELENQDVQDHSLITLQTAFGF